MLRLLDGRLRFHYWPDNTSVYLLRIGDANIFYTEDGFFVAPPAAHPYIRVHTPERLQTADQFHRPDLLPPILKKIWEE